VRIVDPDSHEPTELVVEAARALAILGDMRAIEPLVRIMDPDSDNADELVARAASALDMFDDRRAIELLGKALLNMSDFGYGKEIMEALHEFGLPAVPYLAEVYYARGRDVHERTAALNALEKILGKVPENES